MTGASRLLLWGGVAIVLWLVGRTAWRVHHSVELTRMSEPLQHAPQQASLSLLIVGDSTAVGTGASGSQASVAGLLVQAFPRLRVHNRARDGATLAQLMTQMEGEQRVDMVLVMAGGNDVVRLRNLRALQSDIDRVLARARERSNQVVFMPAGNVGNAPFFFPPVSWLMTWRSRQLHAIARESSSRHGATFVNLFRERADDPFFQQPGLNARDGLHPSDAGYQLWFTELMTQADLPQRLSAALTPPPETASPQMTRPSATHPALVRR